MICVIGTIVWRQYYTRSTATLTRVINHPFPPGSSTSAWPNHLGHNQFESKAPSHRATKTQSSHIVRRSSKHFGRQAFYCSHYRSMERNQRNGLFGWFFNDLPSRRQQTCQTTIENHGPKTLYSIWPQDSHIVREKGRRASHIQKRKNENIKTSDRERDPTRRRKIKNWP